MKLSTTTARALLAVLTAICATTAVAVSGPGPGPGPYQADNPSDLSISSPEEHFEKRQSR